MVVYIDISENQSRQSNQCAKKFLIPLTMFSGFC